MENLNVITIDIAKSVFQLHGFTERKETVFTKKLYRGEMLNFFSNLKPCKIAMEACGGSHYWARELERLGHTVRLISGEFVKQFVNGNKNDRIDASAIGEAFFSHRVRFISANSIEQQDLQMKVRVRARLIGTRTKVINEIHGFLLEYGLAISKSVSKISAYVEEALEGAGDRVTLEGRRFFRQLCQEVSALNERIEEITKELEEKAKEHPVAKRLCDIPGIGSITAVSLVAAAGDPSLFKNGRHFAAWLGLVPQQYSSGGKTVLGRITKRGDSYLRSLLIQGAHACVSAIRFYKPDKKAPNRVVWMRNLKSRIGHQKAAVAMANKNARIAWAIMSKADAVYVPDFKHAA